MAATTGITPTAEAPQRLPAAVAVTARVFLDPVAHGGLPVLHLFVNALLDERALHFHVALHIERHPVCADELLEHYQERQILSLVLVEKALQIFKVIPEERYYRPIVYLVEFQGVLFLCRFVYSHTNNLSII